MLLGLGAAWLYWQRKSRTLAILGALVMGVAGVVTAWYPALQAQRTMLWTDRLPVAIAVATLALVALRARSVQVAVAIALACAGTWLVASCDFWGFQTDAQSVLLLGLVATAVVLVPRRSNRFIAAGALLVLALAFAVPGLLLASVQSRGFMPPPGFESRLECLHPLVAGAIGLACLLVLLLCGRTALRRVRAGADWPNPALRRWHRLRCQLQQFRGSTRNSASAQCRVA